MVGGGVLDMWCCVVVVGVVVVGVLVVVVVVVGVGGVHVNWFAHVNRLVLVVVGLLERVWVCACGNVGWVGRGWAMGNTIHTGMPQCV